MHGLKLRDRRHMLPTHLATIMAAAATVSCELHDQFLKHVADVLRRHAHRGISELDVAAAIAWATQHIEGCEG
jgi:hypothetical protein